MADADPGGYRSRLGLHEAALYADQAFNRMAPPLHFGIL